VIEEMKEQCIAYEHHVRAIAERHPALEPDADRIKSLIVRVDQHLKEAKELQVHEEVIKSTIPAPVDLKPFLLSAHAAINNALVACIVRNGFTPALEKGSNPPSTLVSSQRQTQQRSPTESPLFEPMEIDGVGTNSKTDGVGTNSKTDGVPTNSKTTLAVYS
jgi:hypothetical protein